MIWLNLAVIPRFSWPNARISLPFAGKTIVLLPPSETLACQVSILNAAGADFAIDGTTLSRFLSRLAWAQDAGVREIFFSGSNNPMGPGRLEAAPHGRSAWATVPSPHCIYLPAAISAEADLALALYREGMSLHSAPFAFLSYCKVLNIRMSDRVQQERWINDNLHKLWYAPALNRLAEVRAGHADVGHYMYVQGRCAVAHANGPPLVDPDLYTDKKRLQDDLPLMKALAAQYIESELGVPSDSSFRECSDEQRSSPLLVKGPVVDDCVTYAPYRHRNQ